MKLLISKLGVILIDLLGISLIVLAGLLGWLPGPGGIPLLIAGLGLLSINHQWAKRWLKTVKIHGVKLSDKLFNNSPRITFLIDVVGVLLIAVGVSAVVYITGSVARTAGISLSILALFLLLGNRKRFQRIRKKH